MGECWGGIRVNQRECARRCLQVAEGRKGELDVGPVEAGTAAEEAAGLVKAQGQRAAARQQVVHAGPGLAPPGIELVVQGRYGGAVDQADVEVVLQFAPHSGAVVKRGDTERLELFGRTSEESRVGTERVWTFESRCA